MRAVLQRVTSASVRTAEGYHREIGPGLLVLLGVGRDDTAEDGSWLARKVVGLRIFSDDAGPMNRAVGEAGGDILVVSQFTLQASVRKGARPSYNDAAPPELARQLYEDFVAQLQAASGRPVPTGQFGAMMQVALVNDGPVTIVIDTKRRE
jgi:D-aminoacyl-tRNA deacylase